MSSVEEFAELFALLQSDRLDVRRRAVEALAQESNNSGEFLSFLSSSTHGPRSVDLLLQFFHVGGMSLLGDILTVFINCSTDCGCREMFVRRKTMRKAISLLDGLESFDRSVTLRRGVEKMALLLMNNLMASHICAVDDLLQMEDEDMRGFYLGKLLQYFTRLDIESASENVDADDFTCVPARDLQRLVLQILLHVTNESDGQAQLLEDEDWAQALVACLGAPVALHRVLVAKCFCNCVSRKELHANILRSSCVQMCVERLCDGSEESEDIEMLLAEIVAGIMGSEEGMAFLEGMNAKKHLQAATAGNKIHEPTIKFLSQHVVPSVDDVVDAYIIPGSDEVD